MTATIVHPQLLLAEIADAHALDRADVDLAAAAGFHGPVLLSRGVVDRVLAPTHTAPVRDRRGRLQRLLRAARYAVVLEQSTATIAHASDVDDVALIHVHIALARLLPDAATCVLIRLPREELP